MKIIKKVGTSHEGSNAIEQIVMDSIMYWKGVREYDKRPYHEDKSQFDYEFRISCSVNNITKDINKFCQDRSQGIRVVI
jgi:hypothetical protein